MQPNHYRVTLQNDSTSALGELYVRAADDSDAVAIVERYGEGGPWRVISAQQWSPGVDAGEAIRAALALRQPVEWSETQQQIVEASIRRGFEPLGVRMIDELARGRRVHEESRAELRSLSTMALALVLNTMAGWIMLSILLWKLVRSLESIAGGAG